MKDRILRLGLLPIAEWPKDAAGDGAGPRPLASPAPELEGVSDQMRQLHDAYADHHDVPDALARLAQTVADAYERVADPGQPDDGAPADRPNANGDGRRLH